MKKILDETIIYLRLIFWQYLLCMVGYGIIVYCILASGNGGIRFLLSLGLLCMCLQLLVVNRRYYRRMIREHDEGMKKISEEIRRMHEQVLSKN